MRPVVGPTDHVVVVGAGLGGLAAAMHLAGAGRQVTVLEREPVPGGRAGRLELDGPSGRYRFDTGPTVLTMPHLIDRAFAAVGESTSRWLTLTDLDPLYRAWFPDGSSLDVHSDTDAMATQIATVIGPREAAGYRRFVDYVSTLYRLQIDSFIDRNLDSPWSLVTADLARLAALGGFGRLAPRIARFFDDPRTQRVFSFQSLYAGVSPQQALALYAVISYMDSVAGVVVPHGGMHALPTAMAAAAAAHGVEFRYGTEVTQVLVAGDRALGVRTATGEEIRADVVVVNPDLPVAYRDLLGQQPRSVRRLRYSPSCLLLLVGSRATYRAIAHHNIHFGRAWREVFADVIDGGRLMRDPSILVTNPTRTEPSLAPAGRQEYYVLLPTPNLHASIDWHVEGPRYAAEAMGVLERRGYVGFADAVEVLDVTTPAHWHARGMAAGTPFAAAHTFAQTGPFRPGNRWGRNVVFVGSGTRPGVGVPMVLISGRLAAEQITAGRRRSRTSGRITSVSA